MSEQQVIDVQAPPSKSVSHRMVIGAALAAGESRLANVLESEDLDCTRSIMETCGARIERLGDGLYAIRGVAGTPAGGGVEPASCYVKESGTTCRLLTGVLASGLGRFRIHGAARMHERPIGDLTDALEALGVGVEWEGRKSYPPMVLDTCGLKGTEVTIGLDESSQYISGLLLAAPMAKAMTITVGGEKAVSWPYVGLTLKAMEEFGLKFHVEMLNDKEEWAEVDWRTLSNVVPGRTRFIVKPGMYRAGDYRVEGDWSNASYFLAAGAVGPAPVRVNGLRADSLQGDKAMLDILKQMGARIEIERHAVTVFPSSLKGIEVDMGHCPDLVPTVAAVAAFAKGETTISNVAHLRIKECDRLSSPSAELAKAGVVSEVLEDGLRVIGNREAIAASEGTVFCTYNDHRMAMSLAVLGFAGVDVQVDDPKCVAKSFPGFWREWKKVAR